MSSQLRFTCKRWPKWQTVLLLIMLGLFISIASKTWSEVNPCTLFDLSSCNQPIPLLVKNNLECTKYGYKPRNPNATNTSLPIYDFFIFHDEFDTLEIRLHELYKYVSFFLIAESRQTLSGKLKPLYLQDNWSNFTKYHNKMRRIEVELDLNLIMMWSNEHRMRNDGLRKALSTVTDKTFLLLTSDADEIPKARFMNALSSCELPKPLPPSVLNCDFYYYSYEYRSKSHMHYGSTLTLIDSDPSKSPSGLALRDQRFRYHILPSTCYHCTWCFNQLKEVRLKMASYAHKEHNEIRFREREHILDRYRHGTDLFDRPGEEYVYMKNNTDYPELVILQPERFMYMTKRSNLTNAGFIDA